MQRKDQNLMKFLKDKKVSPLIYLYFELNNLKQLYRRGWLKRGIPEHKCESIADHLFGQSILTLFAAEQYSPNLDIKKLLVMSLIHELGEIYIGDITPTDHISKDIKYQWELRAVVELFSKIPNNNYYINLWKEYEEAKTSEAKFVRDIDILETALQSVIYRLQYNYKSLEEFIPRTEKRIRNKKLLELLEESGELLKMHTNQK